MCVIDGAVSASASAVARTHGTIEINGTSFDGNVVFGDQVVSLAEMPALFALCLPESVTGIAARSLKDCKKLTILNAPGVEDIGEEAFLNCALRHVVLSAEQISLGDRAFFGMSNTFLQDEAIMRNFLPRFKVLGKSVSSYALPSAVEVQSNWRLRRFGLDSFPRGANGLYLDFRLSQLEPKFVTEICHAALHYRSHVVVFQKSDPSVRSNPTNHSKVIGCPLGLPVKDFFLNENKQVITSNFLPHLQPLWQDHKKKLLTSLLCMQRHRLRFFPSQAQSMGLPKLVVGEQAFGYVSNLYGARRFRKNLKDFLLSVHTIVPLLLHPEVSQARSEIEKKIKSSLDDYLQQINARLSESVANLSLTTE